MKTQLKVAILLLASSVIYGSAALSPESTTERDRRMAWFREARFGMFIHWGLYALPAGEWNGKPISGGGEWIMQTGKIPVAQYEKLMAQFNPVKFEAQQWVRIAKKAGMKYIVITSKHHDGFGLWESKLTDWSIQSTPFKRDPLKELAKACKDQDIVLCFYYSIMDWHHADYTPRRPWNDVAVGEADFDRYVAYMKGQLKELLTGYGRVGILWFDGEWEKSWTQPLGIDLYQYVRGLQPDIIINNRVGKARAGMSGMDQGQERVGDYGTPEQEIPATGFGPGIDWESCMTMNNTWGFKKSDENWKSSQTLIRNLVDCASKGGNYLLNVGPTAEGLIPSASVERLVEIGKWMEVNHESIYGTSASPFKHLRWGRCTRKQSASETTLYLHVFEWPKDGKLLVPGLKNEPAGMRLLGDQNNRALPGRNEPGGLTIELPPQAPDSAVSTIEVKLKGALEIEPTHILQDAEGAIILTAMDAQIHGEQMRYESGPQRNNLGFWTNPGDWADWEFRVSRPGKFAVSAEISALRPAMFEVSIGEQKLKATAPVTGDYGAFEWVNLGTVELGSRGNVTLAVRPLPQNWSPINLKSVRLKPITP